MIGLEKLLLFGLLSFPSCEPRPLIPGLIRSVVWTSGVEEAIEMADGETN